MPAVEVVLIDVIVFVEAFFNWASLLTGHLIDEYTHVMTKWYMMSTIMCLVKYLRKDYVTTTVKASKRCFGVIALRLFSNVTEWLAIREMVINFVKIFFCCNYWFATLHSIECHRLYFE